MSDEIVIAATFDTDDTAAEVARAVNRWGAWIMENDVDNVPEIFEDLGLDTSEYALSLDEDIDWEEPPRALASGTMTFILLDSSESVDIVQELVESCGAYEVGPSDDAPEELYSGDFESDEDEDDSKSTTRRAAPGAIDENDEIDDEDL